jgi:deoxyribose-phosphate aldolase
MKLNKYIDHTILKPFAKKEDIKRFCEEAKEYDYASVCINPCHVKFAKELLKCTSVNVCTVIGFPLGANRTETKAYEAELAYEDGCDEFDMVINIGALKDKNYDYVRSDIAAVVKAAKGKCVKAIIETGLLTDEEIAVATRIACEAGATFVKTCTGVSEGVATVKDIKIMKENITGNVKIKASTGIKTKEIALELIEAGAERLGTSSGKIIVG